jgi:peptidoglycan/LPS O-acetylase OafA/YrhL
MNIEQLTFTRFIAAISIVIYHFGRDVPIFFRNGFSFFFAQSTSAVSYFFILSGFVMVVAYISKARIHNFNYFIRRFVRIYPVYFLSILLFISSPYWINSGESLQDIYINLFLIQSWIPGKALSLNTPSWSISVEVFFYLIFPFLFNRIYKILPLKKLIFPILFFWGLSQLIYHHNLKTDFPLAGVDVFYFPLIHLNEFLIGNLAGLYFMSKTQVYRNYDWLILVIFCCIILAFKYPFGADNRSGLLAFLFVPMIFFISLNNGFITRVFSKKPLVFLGEISYGIYILQFPVWLWMTDARLENSFHIEIVSNYTLVFFIRLFALMLVASLSYHFLESPFREKVNKLLMNPKSLD